MYLFKTSGATIGSVIQYQCHAFTNLPAGIRFGDIILVSKNRSDCRPGEKQIQYVMHYLSVRCIKAGEVSALWGPENEGRWKYIIQCEKTQPLIKPFDLEDVLGEAAARYAPVMTHCRLQPQDEAMIFQYLNLAGSNPARRLIVRKKI